MAGWGSLGAGARAGIVGAGAVVIAGIGWLVFDATRPEPAPEQGASAPVASQTAAEVAAAPSVSPSAAPTLAESAATPTETPPAPPQIGTWLVGPDGGATIAGTAEPRALVKVLVDGLAVAETTASRGGEFAVVATLAPNPAPSLMSLVMVLENGTEIVSTQTVALGPIAAPPSAAATPAASATAEAPAASDGAAAVPDAEAPAALMLTEEGATVLHDPAVPSTSEPAAPGEVAAVTIETISYTAAGAVQLGGSAEPGAVVRLYLDNKPIQDVAVPDSGKWLATLAETAPGVYTLRADQVDDMGLVTSRFETPFKRETLEALAAAAGEAPEAAVSGEASGAEADATAEPAVPPEPAQEAVAEAPAAAPEPAPEAGAEANADPAEAPPAATPEATPLAEAPGAEDSAAPAVVAEAPVAAASPDAAEPPAAPGADMAGSGTGPSPAAAPAADAAPAAPSAPPVVTVTVQPGNTLWAIAEGQMGEGIRYVQVYEANKEAIRDPDLIYPGQIFTIPTGN